MEPRLSLLSLESPIPAPFPNSPTYYPSTLLANTRYSDSSHLSHLAISEFNSDLFKMRKSAGDDFKVSYMSLFLLLVNDYISNLNQSKQIRCQLYLHDTHLFPAQNFNAIRKSQFFHIKFESGGLRNEKHAPIKNYLQSNFSRLSSNDQINN